MLGQRGDELADVVDQPVVGEPLPHHGFGVGGGAVGGDDAAEPVGGPRVVAVEADALEVADHEAGRPAIVEGDQRVLGVRLEADPVADQQADERPERQVEIALEPGPATSVAPAGLQHRPHHRRMASCASWS